MAKGWTTPRAAVGTIGREEDLDLPAMLRVGIFCGRCRFVWKLIGFDRAVVHFESSAYSNETGSSYFIAVYYSLTRVETWPGI